MSDWWQGAVGYEVYVPSFHDSNGDGWGDLPGVTAKLDYLAWLGVDLIWLTPFYRSPMHDHGYDISDYCDVDPRFGTLRDFDELLDAAHRRGLRVIADLVANHTSHEHPWFRRARSSRDDPYRDYYLWRPGRGPGEPPNNWPATFGGPAWTYDPDTGEWYEHLFTPEQPDLNWADPRVAAEFDGILRFWLDRGLDGFRIDTAHYLAKDPALADNPLLDPSDVAVIGGAVGRWYEFDHVHDIGQDAVRAIHRRWRAITEEYDAFLVGETHLLDPARLAGFLDGDGLHSYFWFGLVQSTPAAGQDEADLLRAASQASPALSWTQSSHDWSRAATRYGADRALALATLAAGLPGTLFLYQGDELGLSNAVVSAAEARDPLAVRGGNLVHNRDASRTPMPWAPGPGLGFTTAPEPWLTFGGRTDADTVAVQASDPDSPLHATRRLLSAVHAAGASGPVSWLDTPPGVHAYQRGATGVAANLTSRPVRLALPTGWTVAYTTLGRPGADVVLAPDSAAVLSGPAAGALQVRVVGADTA